MNKTMSNNEVLRLELAARILAGMLSDWTTLSNATYPDKNKWENAPSVALGLADKLIAEAYLGKL
jgi:hypothetical protein